MFRPQGLGVLVLVLGAGELAAARRTSTPTRLTVSLSTQGHMGDALASVGDEGRDKLR